MPQNSEIRVNPVGFSVADIQVQIYSKSSWNSKGWRIGKDLCLTALQPSWPYNSWTHNAILFLPYPPSHASFNHCFPFCIPRFTRSTFQSSPYLRTNANAPRFRRIFRAKSYSLFQRDIYARYMKSFVLLPKSMLILEFNRALNQIRVKINASIKIGCVRCMIVTFWKKYT